MRSKGGEKKISPVKVCAARRRKKVLSPSSENGPEGKKLHKKKKNSQFLSTASRKNRKSNSRKGNRETATIFTKTGDFKGEDPESERLF